MTSKKQKNADAEHLNLVFRQEAEELISSAEDALLILEDNFRSINEQKRFFHVLHSLKGNASCVNDTELETFIHRVETSLHPVREGTKIFSESLIEALFQILYAVRDKVISSKDLPPEDSIHNLEELVASAPLLSDTSQATHYRIFLQYPGESLSRDMDPSFILQDIADTGTITSVEIEPSSIPLLEEIENPDALMLRYCVDLHSTDDLDRLRQACFIFDDVIHTTIEISLHSDSITPASTTDSAAYKNSIRIDVRKLDSLMRTAGELATRHTRLDQLIREKADHRVLRESTIELVECSASLQDELLSARMTTIDVLFRPFVRMTRELATSLGKRIRLYIHGEEVELDKSIIEHMREPMTHLVRNAIDHGIELPEERMAAGKPAEGHLIIRARQSEGNIYLEISDDGRGINRDALIKKSRRFETDEPTDELSEAKIDDLIFESGVSTASEITNTSGRGLGMGIVRKSIQDIRGNIQVESSVGSGTTFRVRLPLTLAIIDGFLIGAGGQTYVIPIHTISECRSLSTEEHRKAERSNLLNLGGSAVPYLSLRRYFKRDEVSTSHQNIVVVRDEERKVALGVDTLEGDSKTVITPLGPIFHEISGISGSTILGDGRVAPILDVGGIISDAFQRFEDIAAERNI